MASPPRTCPHMRSRGRTGVCEMCVSFGEVGSWGTIDCGQQTYDPQDLSEIERYYQRLQQQGQTSTTRLPRFNPGSSWKPFDDTNTARTATLIAARQQPPPSPYATILEFPPGDETPRAPQPPPTPSMPMQAQATQRPPATQTLPTTISTRRSNTTVSNNGQLAPGVPPTTPSANAQSGPSNESKRSSRQASASSRRSDHRNGK